MNIIFAIQHPAHVHLFRNSIELLSKEGHNIYTFAREKDINVELLNQYDIDYELLVNEPKRSWQLPFVQLEYEWELIKAARQLDTDVLVAMGEPAITHAARVSSATSLILTDTEHATLQNMLSFPFADRILTPDCYQGDIGEKQIRYPGYHELAYLHPDRFEPDPDILEDVGVDQDERLVILRLVSWDAVHDIGDSGLDDVADVVRELEAAGATVLVTSEDPLPEKLESRRVDIAPHRIHHLLYYADLFVGESATMATESAVLGTPAVFISSSRRGYTDELEDRYGLVFNYSGTNKQANGLQKALSIIEAYDDVDWERKREQLLADKTDTTSVIIDHIEEISLK